jgi:peptide/nickel transport system permease protein
MDSVAPPRVSAPATPATALSAPVAASRRIAGRRRRQLRVLFRSPLTVFGAVVLVILGIFAIWPVAWLPHDPYAADISLRFIPPVWESGGNPDYILGTDALGRDMLSMIMHGARYSLLIVTIAGIISLVVGVAAGLFAGFSRGWPDEVIMRLVDIQLAFPLVVLIIAIVAVLGSNLFTLILVLGLEGWARFARVVRGNVLSLREKEFVDAARAAGASSTRIMRAHLLPNTITPIAILLTFDFARLLLLESALSFLGLGVQPPTPSWGSMIADGRQYLFEAWWNSAIPGLVIVVAVLAFNFLGDGFRDALDPLSQLD